MSKDANEREYPILDLQDQQQQQGSMLEVVNDPPDIASRVVDETSKCIQQAIDRAAIGEQASAAAFERIEQSVINGYFELLKEQNLTDDKIEQYKKEIQAAQDKVDTKDSAIRDTNTKRFKHLLKTIYKIAKIAGGLYLVTKTFDLIRDIAKDFRRS